MAAWLTACGGGSDPVGSPATPPAAAPSPVAPTPPQAAPTPSAVVLKAPVLAFTDTGLSVSDGVTRNGLWSVSSEEQGWEYSLDQGRSWVRGSGGAFEVMGDGPKMIWVRARDDQGNTSEIVIVTCVLDTTAPSAVTGAFSSEGATQILQIAGLEAGAQWQYSVDGQQTWLAGSGRTLSVLGNDLARVSLRQVDVAGNASAPQPFLLEQPGTNAWHEASNNPFQPSVVLTGAQTVLIHGSVVRGDADHVRWDIPAGHRLASVRLVRYQSEDLVAFYAIQRGAVFDAGVDVSRMLVYGHMGPPDLLKNVVSQLPGSALGMGPMTLWFQQTGSLATRYAIEVVIEPVP
jgi:hypothetical protein